MRTNLTRQPEDDTNEYPLIWRIRWRIFGPTYVPLWWRVTGWLRKCEDCGKRFGRHDETKQHTPF